MKIYTRTLSTITQTNKLVKKALQIGGLESMTIEPDRIDDYFLSDMISGKKPKTWIKITMTFKTELSAISLRHLYE